MNHAYKKLGNLSLATFIGFVGFALYFSARSKSSGNWPPDPTPDWPIHGVIAAQLAAGWFYAKAKGQSGWLGILLMSALSVFGLIILYNLEDRSTPASSNAFTKSDTRLVDASSTIKYISIWHGLNFAVGRFFCASMIVALPLHIAIGMLWDHQIFISGHTKLAIMVGIGIIWAIIGWIVVRRAQLNEAEEARVTKALNYASVGNLTLLIALVAAAAFPSGVLLIYPILFATAFLMGIPVAALTLRAANRRNNRGEGPISLGGTT